MISENLTTEDIWKILETFGLSEQEKHILHLSYRTRGKIHPETNLLEIQFKWEETVAEAQIQELIQKLTPLFEEYFAPDTILVKYKIGECCGKECFCCKLFALSN